MKTSTKFKDYKTVQKIGLVFIILGGAITLCKILDVITASHFIEEDLPNYMFLAGALLFMLPTLKKRFIGRNGPEKISVLLLALSTSIGSMAQDYSKQIDAFEQSFTEKSVSPIQAYVSPTLKFDPIPVANTPAILTNIVSNLPELNAMAILESSKGFHE